MQEECGQQTQMETESQGMWGVGPPMWGGEGSTALEPRCFPAPRSRCAQGWRDRPAGAATLPYGTRTNTPA